MEVTIAKTIVTHGNELRKIGRFVLTDNPLVGGRVV
ncbi:similar to An07g02510 [Aspergillus luchuensis]|uniref:Similar to An07g02510 n=1 Tax=Aspergillus kawachii TaxID=1069201 RepID=A0A146F8P3_ASPKA|nr:similar to An07g02510 [Aspergillus luchuensis]